MIKTSCLAAMSPLTGLALCVKLRPLTDDRIWQLGFWVSALSVSVLFTGVERQGLLPAEVSDARLDKVLKDHKTPRMWNRALRSHPAGLSRLRSIAGISLSCSDGIRLEEHQFEQLSGTLPGARCPVSTGDGLDAGAAMFSGPKSCMKRDRKSVV